jgi:hypothetical protein
VRGSFASGNFTSGHVVYITSLCGLLAWFALARGHRATFPGPQDSGRRESTCDESPIAVSWRLIGVVVTGVGVAGSPRVDHEQAPGTRFG